MALEEVAAATLLALTPLALPELVARMRSTKVKLAKLQPTTTSPRTEELEGPTREEEGVGRLKPNTLAGRATAAREVPVLSFCPLMLPDLLLAADFPADLPTHDAGVPLFPARLSLHTHCIIL